MIRLYSPLAYFKSSMQFNDFDIIHGSIVVDQIPDEHRYFFGGGIIGDIATHFVYFKYLDPIIDNVRLEINTISTLNNKLFFLLWIIKDHCCHNQLTVIVNDDINQSTFSNSGYFCTNSSGNYIVEYFSEEDFTLAYSYLSSLEQLMAKLSTPSIVTHLDSGIVQSKVAHLDYHEFTSVDIAIKNINKARHTSNIIEKISYYIIALEGLFALPGENDNLTFKLSYRVPLFLDESSEKKDDIFNNIRSGYYIRSKAFHGDIISKNKTEDSYLINISVCLDNVLRKTFNILINDTEKRDILTNKDKFTHFFHSKFLGIK